MIPKERVESLAERKGSPFGPRVNGIGDFVRRIFPGDLTPDPNSFLTVSDGGSVRQYDHDSWGELWHWQPATGAGSVAGISIWNDTVVGITNQDFIEFVKLNDNNNVKKVKISAPKLAGSSLQAVGLMHYAPQVVVASMENVGLIDLETGRAIRNVENEWVCTNYFQQVPNQRGLAIQLDTGGKIKVWDFNSNNKKPLKLIPGIGGYPHELQFNPTNLNEFICASNGQPLKIFDFTAGRARQTIESGEKFTSHSIYANVLLQTGNASAVSITDLPDEELQSFTCSNYGEAMICGIMTASSAIVVCTNSFVEFKYTK